MPNLFDNNRSAARPPPLMAGLLKPTPELAGRASAYGDERRDRPHADPLGLGSLPDTREDLNRLLLDLCRRLASAGGRNITGKHLVAELGLPDTRSLRLLVAYGHVHHRIRQIVGTPGSGYCWGDCRPGAYGDMAAASRRMGICFLFNASLYSRKPPAVEMAQMALDFTEQSAQAGKARTADELTAWLSTEGVTHADLIDAMVEMFAASDAGREALRRAGRKHRGVFLPAETLIRLERQLRDLQTTVQAVQTAKASC